MSDDHERLRADSHPELPDALVEELRRAYRAHDGVPEGLDEAILGTAAARARGIRLSQGGGRRWWIGVAVGAAAAAVLALVLLRGPLRARDPVEQTAEQPLPRLEENTEVTVLHAFRLARLLRDARPGLAGAGWDVDGSGTVDEIDVERLLDRAVRVEGV